MGKLDGILMTLSSENGLVKKKKKNKEKDIIEKLATHSNCTSEL